jgi:oligosaccharyltransferase complex subunit alpha (ribophorin I)
MRWWSIAASCSVLLSGVNGAQSNLTHVQSSQQILQGDFQVPQVFENTNLVRNTNLEKGYVRETINVVVTNVGKSPEAEYYLPFQHEVMAKVGGLEVRDKKAAEKGTFAITTAASASVEGLDGVTENPAQYYVLHFPEPLQPKASITLTISYHILGALQPLPATIEQTEKQYLTYSFSAYFPSAYPTIKQKTKVKFPSADIPEYTTTTGLTSTADPEKQGKVLTYGPYDTKKVPSGTTSPVSVRYEFTNPVLTCTLLERDIEVSHWGGNIATEERYWLGNSGASLKNHFSRVAWQTQNYYAQSATSALKELKVPLKSGSVDPYFTDDIGNVSTSRYRPSSVHGRDAMLELKPRYPVFGGWKYSFRIGWNNALSTFLRKVKAGGGETYALGVPFLEGPKMPEGIQYEHFVLRIILPEGAKNIRWETIGGIGLPILTSEQSLHKTFMDTVGRTELKLSAMNVVDEARDAKLLVLYDYPFSAAFRKPLTIAAGVLGLFVMIYGLGLIDTRIGKS